MKNLNKWFKLIWSSKTEKGHDNTSHFSDTATSEAHSDTAVVIKKSISGETTAALLTFTMALTQK